MGKNKAQAPTLPHIRYMCFDLTNAPVATTVRAAATGPVSMLTGPSTPKYLKYKQYLEYCPPKDLKYKQYPECSIGPRNTFTSSIQNVVLDPKILPVMSQKYRT